MTAKQRPAGPARGSVPEPHMPEQLDTDAMNVASATDFTGLIPAGDSGHNMLDAYAEFYPFEDDERYQF